MSMLPYGNASPYDYLIFTYYCSRGLTLEEALQIAYGDDLDVDKIYIEPPESGVLSDEDSANEEEGG